MDIFIEYISIGLGFVICILMILIGNVGLGGVRSLLACKKVIKALSSVAGLSRAAMTYELNAYYSYTIRYSWADGHCIILVGSSCGFNIHSYEADKLTSVSSDEYHMLVAAVRNLRDKMDFKNN